MVKMKQVILIFIVSIILVNLKTTLTVVSDEADLPIKRLNAGHATTFKIPLEETLERIRSYPHRKDALIRSLGATALKQRAGRNLIFRVLLTIGKH